MKIFCDAKLSRSALELLRDGVAPHELVLAQNPASSVLAKADLDPAFEEAEVAFGQPDIASVENSTKLRWLQLSSAGFTRYDTPEFRALAAERGLAVTNSSGVYAEACAEHVFAFMLAQARGLPRALTVHVPSSAPEWVEARGACRSLRGQTVVILGYGSIAARLVELLAPFDARIIAMRRKPRGDEGVETITPERLDEALAVADHVVNILPENADSQNFINASRLAAMRRGAVFYNIGRGGTVDQTALAEALRSGHLAAAWLDVSEPEPLPPDHPLRALPNCFLTPHIAGGHHDEAETLVRHFLENFRRFLDGAELRDRII